MCKRSLQNANCTTVYKEKGHQRRQKDMSGDAQPEAQDEVFPCCETVDLVLRPNEFCENRLLRFAKLFHELAFVMGDAIYCPLQL